MNTNNLLELIGHKTGGRDEAYLRANGLMMRVIVLDAKVVYGRIDVQITPVAGAGKKWVRVDSLTEIEEG